MVRANVEEKVGNEG